MTKRMAHTIADYSTPIDRSVQSKEVLDIGPIAADQLGKAGCLQVVDQRVHHLGGHRWTSSRIVKTIIDKRTARVKVVD